MLRTGTLPDRARHEHHRVSGQQRSSGRCRGPLLFCGRRYGVAAVPVRCRWLFGWSLAVVVAVAACGSPAAGGTLHVVLVVEAGEGAPGVWLFEGDTVGLVDLAAEPPATRVGARTGERLEQLRSTLTAAGGVAAEPLAMPLPAVPEGGAELDIRFFRDLDGDVAWDEGEPYVSAWDGGRGGFRLVSGDASPTDSPPPAGWLLLEGGDPPRVGPAADAVVRLDVGIDIERR